MQSCIYEGTVQHHRDSPARHQFRFPLFMVYVDLTELETPDWNRTGIARRRFAAASLRTEDHFGESSTPLREAVLDCIEAETQLRPNGPIRLLTQLRYFGHYFSPLNLYFCFSPDGQQIEFIVAEVNNTPWGEQYRYVLWDGNRIPGKDFSFLHRKEFHVSPFQDMDAEYRWQVTWPGEQLNVRIVSEQAGRPRFWADLTLRRRSLTRWQLYRSLVRYPFLTVQIMAAIYFQALRLWIKRFPFYPHPSRHQSMQRTP